ncbi:hypothetical protein FT663_02123 [Candidozyma haemuli var. vulneris]|uniref:mRNA-capping enzyme subunit beta n=1 Tax=Candidozyma haemuli TaxID=45357 RepID=A0A2V1ANS5_9ASCO|nr:hypothetical protein CXQ85_001184 [[Candida] haemuloni]KAF3990382.1 hypothetical protein FT662_02276 [[Candida] haemuloni var. vulneris]KAF3992814.1 hypothetical protein FT663_02123 [[Candida] haemuloni var. vulneris]PVH18893.1 hypothetical protein CXQ85_001184 [[Candida] haemuloni]
MNVGSILNGESQPAKKPEDDSSKSSEPKPSASPHQRHSINNLLNDPAPAAAAEHKDSDGSFTETPRPYRSSIASLTNDKDVDFTTGRETTNVSRTSVEETKPIPVSTEFDDKEVVSPKTEVKKELEEKTEKPEQPVEKTKEKKSETPEVKQDGEGSATPERKRSSVVDSKEIATLNKLKSSSRNRKPRRYNNPPIWAQEWIPTSQKWEGHVQKQHPTEPAENGNMGVSDKHVFNQGQMTSVDLECSVTGVLPPPSVVRTIAEWIYANFVEIPLDNRQFLELELKFGTIIDKSTGRRLDLGVSTECIYTKSSNVRFDMGVHEVGWKEMTNYLEELEKAFQEEKRKTGAKGRKFSTLDSDVTDQFFQITERNEQPKKVRISKDNTLTPPRYVAIEKKRVSDLYIHNPMSMYDLRLSMSFEFPVPENSVEPILKKNKPSLTRMKKRNTWNHTPTVTRFDFTKVSVPKATKNKSGKSVMESDTSHEVELEMDPVEIFRGFDKIRDGSDTIRFEELVEIFLNNARILNNRVTKLASK